MFVKTALAAFFVSLLAVMVNADTTPDEPGPGTIFKEGGTCMTTWSGDTVSPTAWKNMSIELMTGSNFNMVHLTTVASNLDGTIAGAINFTCPKVTLNSAVYFFQYTAPGASDKQWTTRFTIASGSGATTPPPNGTQPGTGEAIPWGVGALIDPSMAIPPPAYLGGGASSSGTSSTPPANATSGTPSTPNILPTSSAQTVGGLPPPSPDTFSPSSTTAKSGSGSSTKTGTGSGTTSTGSTTNGNGAIANAHSIGGVVLAAAFALTLTVAL